MLWIKTTNLQNNVVHLISTNDTLVTYVNELNQRVYDMPVQQLDPTLIKQLAKVDSSYQVLQNRIKALNKANKDIIASMDFILEAKGHVVTNYITNEYFGDSTKIEGTEEYAAPIVFKTFEADDSLLHIKSTVTSLLDAIEHDYTLNLGNIAVDLFKAPGRTFDAILTFDNSKLNLATQRVLVASRPVPAFVISAGVGGSLVYSNKQLYAGPSLSVTAGIPLYTFYKRKK